MQQLLVDTAGTVWDAHDWRLRRRYGRTAEVRTLIDFLVRNNGFLSVSLSDETAGIRAAPGSISTVGYLAAGQLIDTSIRRVGLSWYTGQWQHEILIGRDAAMKRLMQLMSTHHSRALGRFLSEPRAVEGIPQTHPHTKLLQLWRAQAGSFQWAKDFEYIHDITDGKFMLVQWSSGAPKLVFAAIGKGSEVYQDRGWIDTFSGKRVEDQPDMRFGSWIANSYREALLANEPRVSDIDVIVSDPKHGNEKHLTYSRLTLPVQSTNGNLQLLSASCPSGDIDLRVKVHHESE
ncbi:MAG: hypothetical protein ACR2PA_25650 [Hyphomicrobiaceae bacterium]